MGAYICGNKQRKGYHFSDSKAADLYIGSLGHITTLPKNSNTKRGSPHLRKTLYRIVCTYLLKAPADEPVYQLLDKKRVEGKPYFVYMTAAQNKFLRIYYAHVKECLLAAAVCLSPLLLLGRLNLPHHTADQRQS